MEVTRKHVLAGVAAGVLVLGAAGAAIAQRTWEGHRGMHGSGMHGPGMHGPGMHGMGGGGLGMMGFPGGGPGPMTRFCRADGSEMADHLIVRVEHRVKPTDAQKQAFEEFKDAVRTAAKKMEAGCPKPLPAATDGTASDQPKKTPIERLADAQTSLEASLDALKTFRPAAEKFYATLDDAQKAKLNERPHWRDREGGKEDTKPEKTPDRG